MKQYTLPQIQLFAKEAGKRDAQALRHMAMAARSAHAAQKDFDKMMRSLDGEAS